MQTLALAARASWATVSTAVASTSATKAAATATRRSASPGTTRTRRPSVVAIAHHASRRFGRSRHAGWIDYNLSERTHARRFTAHFRLIAQRKVNDAPLTARHRTEAERELRALHFVSSRSCTEP